MHDSQQKIPQELLKILLLIKDEHEWIVKIRFFDPPFISQLSDEALQMYPQFLLIAWFVYWNWNRNRIHSIVELKLKYDFNICCSIQTLERKKM